MDKTSLSELVYTVCAPGRTSRDFRDAAKAAMAYARIAAVLDPTVILVRRTGDGRERAQFITGITSVDGHKSKWVSEHAPAEFQLAYQAAVTKLRNRVKSQGMGMQ